MKHNYEREQLFGLLDAFCHGTLSAEQSQNLATILRESPHARRDYLEYMDLHAALQWDVAGRAKIAEIGPQFCEELESMPSPRSRSAMLSFLNSFGKFAAIAFLSHAARRIKRRSRDLRVKMALALAGSLLLAGAVAGTGAILSAVFMRPRSAAEQFEAAHVPEPALAAPSAIRSPAPSSSPSAAPVAAPIARLARCVDCVWSDKLGAPHPGQDLFAGRKLVLKSGLAEIVFANGADTILEGPAALELQSSSSAVLHRGKFSVTAETPSARGFEVGAPGMKYSDLGTEFGLLVSATGQQEVHVFRGRVRAEQGAESKEPQPESRPSPSAKGAAGERSSGTPLPTPRSRPMVLAALEGLRVAAPNAAGEPARPTERIAADEKLFVLTEQIAEIAAQSPEFRRWKKFSGNLCKRADLVAYYDFQADESDPAVLRNRAASGSKLDGRIEGAKWAEGPFRGKHALAFYDGGDRVRVDIPGSFEGCTMAAWINVTDLKRNLNAIAMSDGVRDGFLQGNWQLWPNGSATFGPCWETQSGRFPPGYKPGTSDVVIGHDDMGTWCHLTAVYDLRSGTVVHYKNGRESGSVRIGSGTPLVFGPSQIANCRFPARNLRAMIGELCFFSRALPAEEIKRLCEQTVAEPDEPKTGP